MGTLESADGQARDAEQSDRFLVAGCTPWAKRVFDERLSTVPGMWFYVGAVQELASTVAVVDPRLTFFLHWRQLVPRSVLEATTCIGFHLGAFGRYRGGTPLQHQILDGRRDSDLTIYRMTDEMDAGPVYSTIPVALHGSAGAIYARAMAAAADWITGVVHGLTRDGLDLWEPQPEKLGPLFPRRTPADSRLPEGLSLEQVYDRIRMLDASGYPRAFLEHGLLRFAFRRAVLYDGRLECDCTITLREDGS